MNSKIKRLKWCLVGIMLLMVVFNHTFLESAHTGRTGELKPEKMYYMKSGEKQYFFFKERGDICHFRIMPEIKTKGDENLLRKVGDLNRNLSIEVYFEYSQFIKKNDKRVEVKNKEKRVFYISRLNNKYKLKFIGKRGRQYEEEKDSEKGILQLFLKEYSSFIERPGLRDKKVEIKYRLNFPSIELEEEPAGEKKEELENDNLLSKKIYMFLDLLDVKKVPTVTYYRNGSLTKVPEAFQPLYNKIDKNKHAQSFEGWVNNLPGSRILDLGSVDRPSGEFRGIIEAQERGSLNLVPLIKIIVPLLVILAGILLLYRLLVVNYLKDLKNIQIQVRKPQAIKQVIEAIEELLQEVESKRQSQNPDKMAEIEKKLSELKNSLIAFMEVERGTNKKSWDQIERLAQDIASSKQNLEASIENDHEPLKLKLNPIMAFISEDFPLIAEDLKRESKIEEKIRFIEHRVGKPQSLPDAVYLVKERVTRLDAEVNRKCGKVETEDLEKKEEPETFVVQKEELINKFGVSILKIPGMDVDFNGKVKRLQYEFETFVDNYNRLLKASSIVKRFPDLPGYISGEFKRINGIISFLEDDYKEYSELNENLKELSAGLKEHAETLGQELSKAKGAAEDLDRQHREGNTFLENFENNVKDLKEEKDRINKVVTGLEEQNERLKVNSENVNKGAGKLEGNVTRIETVVGDLENRNTGITDVSEKLKEHKNLLDNAVTMVENVAANLGDQYNRQLNASKKIKGNIDELSKNMKGLENAVTKLSGQNEVWDLVARRLEDSSNTLINEKDELEKEVKNLQESGKLTGEISETLKERIQALTVEMAAVNEVVKNLKEQNKKASSVSENLKGKSDAFIDDVASVEGILADLKTQNKHVEGVIDRLRDKIDELVTQIEKGETVSASLEAQNTRGEQAANGFVEFANDLNSQMDKMEEIVENIENLREEVRNVKGTAKELEDVSQKFAEIDKNLFAWESDSETEIGLYREFINDELHLNLSGINGKKVVGKLKGEPPLSKEYRSYGINLYKELKLLEKNHNDKWYWKLIKPVKDGVDFNIRSFYRRDGKTIYDDHLEGDTHIIELREITDENIKTVINEQHWGQIWEPLLKAAGFFKAYFNEDLEDISEALGVARQKIVNMMESYLGYNVEAYKPLQQISKSMMESGEVKEASNHFVFYRDVLPEIKNNKRLMGAEAIYNEDSDTKLIMFVDTLGLIDNGKRIRKPQMVFYSSTSMKHYK